MEPPVVRASIVEEPIEREPALAPRADAGAHLVFFGRVRDEEDGRPVVALEYEQYPGMAGEELRRAAEEAVRRFRLLDFRCEHRVGRVAVGEASLRVALRARHRAEALEALAWFVLELKTRVPIWKWGITAAGERFPSRGAQESRGQGDAS